MTFSVMAPTFGQLHYLVGAGCHAAARSRAAPDRRGAFRVAGAVGRAWLGLDAGRGLPGGDGGGWVALEDLSLGSGGADGSVGEEFDFPSPPVDADVVVVLAEQDAVFDAGGAAVFFVFDVVDVADGGGAVAAGGPGAVLVAVDDGVPDRRGDVVGVAGVEGGALAVELGAEEGAAQRGGDAAGAGDEVDREPGERVEQGLLVLRRQRLRPRGPGGVAGRGRLAGLGGRAGAAGLTGAARLARVGGRSAGPAAAVAGRGRGSR